MDLKGILGPVPPDFDYEEAKYQYLREKYKLWNKWCLDYLLTPI